MAGQQRVPRFGIVVLLRVLLLAACGRADVPASAPAGAEGAETRPAIQRTLTMMALQVPLNFAAKPLGGLPSGLITQIPAKVLNANLSTYDERGKPLPFLAESLPELNTATWRLFPDGTMETTYRLRPNLTWHDGQPLTAEDFVFAARVYATPEYGLAATVPTQWMAEVLAPDSRTVLIRWSQRYAHAGMLQDGFPPLPRHLLEQAHLESAGAGPNAPSFLPNSPFWNSAYVGAGAYKLDAYNPGVSVEASAFDGFMLGRPRIDRISVRGIPDANAALATMLAGDADASFDQLRGEPGEILQREWGATGGTVLRRPIDNRILTFQFRPDRAQPLEVATDVRVRRALAHALDKQPIFETITNGRGVMSDTYTSPREEIYPLVDREVAKYPYDPRRAQQLLEEAGFVRGSDSKWTTPRGTPFDLPVWYTVGAAAFQQENAIVVAQLNQLGINATSNASNTQSQSPMERALVPGVWSGQQTFLSFRSSETARTENRWTGNRGGYSHPEYDRLASLLDGALDPSEITQVTIELEKHIRTDLPLIFLYYDTSPFAYVGALKGPVDLSSFSVTGPNSVAAYLFNIHEWYWQA